MKKQMLSYLFFALLAANVAMFGFYNFLKTTASTSDSVKTAQSQLKNPITFSNVSSELPPLIGTKK